MESREVVRIVTLRSTIHTHTADDALTLRPLVQMARDRELKIFRSGLEGWIRAGSPPSPGSWWRKSPEP
ncbi:hypothetical protein NKH18_41790 [Streptomyces sp. M10(2022)]